MGKAQEAISGRRATFSEGGLGEDEADTAATAAGEDQPQASQLLTRDSSGAVDKLLQTAVGSGGGGTGLKRTESSILRWAEAEAEEEEDEEDAAAKPATAEPAAAAANVVVAPPGFLRRHDPATAPAPKNVAMADDGDDGWM